MIPVPASRSSAGHNPKPPPPPPTTSTGSETPAVARAGCGSLGFANQSQPGSELSVASFEGSQAAQAAWPACFSALPGRNARSPVHAGSCAGSLVVAPPVEPAFRSHQFTTPGVSGKDS